MKANCPLSWTSIPTDFGHKLWKSLLCQPYTRIDGDVVVPIEQQYFYHFHDYSNKDSILSVDNETCKDCI